MDRQNFRTAIPVEVVHELGGVDRHQVRLNGVVAELPQDLAVLATQGK